MKHNVWKITTLLLAGVMLVGASFYAARYFFVDQEKIGTSAKKTGNSRTISFRAALVYKTGVQPVARNTFYLLSKDLRAIKDELESGIVFMSPSDAKFYSAQGIYDGQIGIIEKPIQEFIVARTGTDFEGNGRFEGVPLGTYWIAGFTTTRSENGYVVWSVKVDTETISGPAMFDQNNAFEAEEW